MGETTAPDKAPQFVPLSKAAPLLGISRQMLVSMIEGGNMPYLASGNRKLVCVEQAKCALMEAAETNRDSVGAHRALVPYSRGKVAGELGTNTVQKKPIRIRPVAI